jgi:UDP-N-acetyl-D-mannosaminuronic acid dehydrogenase
MSLTVFASFGRDEPTMSRTVSVVGLGYIGLPTAVCLAEAGFQVVGVDVNPAVVASLNEAKSHIVEPGLDRVLEEVVKSGGLKGVTAPVAADAYLIAVPTPVGEDAYRTPDMSYVETAVAALAPVLKRGSLIVLESTSPVGSTRRLVRQLQEARPDLRVASPGATEAEIDVDVAYSPERVIPGRTMIELRTNDRVVGGVTPRAARRAAALYAQVTTGEIFITDDRTAEFVKLTENAFRDVNIAFANELSLVCDEQALDVWEVIQLANRHPRVSILQPGPGVGGHCIAVDPWFIVAQSPKTARLIRTAREVNDAKPGWVIDKVRQLADADPQARIACLGLAFKPNVDDFRESPSLEIARELSALYPGRVTCADPFEFALRRRDGLAFGDAAELTAACDIVVALVAHDAFKACRPTDNVAVVDACGLWRGERSGTSVVQGEPRMAALAAVGR